MGCASGARLPLASLNRYYRLAELLRFCGLPLAIAGGWNPPPSEFNWDGSADLVPGVHLFSAGEGACRSARGNYSMLGYWLTSADLHAAFSRPRLSD
eukprot:6440296-Pyramimonas_sp.AAC.1